MTTPRDVMTTPRDVTTQNNVIELSCGKKRGAQDDTDEMDTGEDESKKVKSGENEENSKNEEDSSSFQGKEEFQLCLKPASLKSFSQGNHNTIFWLMIQLIEACCKI